MEHRKAFNTARFHMIIHFVHVAHFLESGL